MRSYQAISHTSEAGLALQGSSLEELFQAGLEGMAQHITGEHAVSESTLSLPILVEAPDITALLVDFLSEVLTLSYIHRAVFHGVQGMSLTATRLQATLIGTPAPGGFDDDIKAVTYHGADIQRNAAGLYETTVIFDI